MIHPSLGSCSLSVTSFQILTPNKRFSLLQVLQRPAQTSLSIPQQRSPLFLSTSPTRDALYLGFAPAMLPLGFFLLSFLCFCRNPCRVVIPFQSSQHPAETQPSQLLCVGTLLTAELVNSTIGSKVTLAVSFPAGQWGL